MSVDRDIATLRASGRFTWDSVKTLRPTPRHRHARRHRQDTTRRVLFPGVSSRLFGIQSVFYVRARDKRSRPSRVARAANKYKFYIDTVNQKRATADITNERPFYSLIQGVSKVFLASAANSGAGRTESPNEQDLSPPLATSLCAPRRPLRPLRPLRLILFIRQAR